MNASAPESSRAVGPVARFTLLIVPFVMNGFFLVYALGGWVVEGRDRFNWAIEAVDVAIWVGLGMLAFSVLVIAFTRFSGGGLRHPLVVSSALHALFALLVAVAILALARP